MWPSCHIMVGVAAISLVKHTEPQVPLYHTQVHANLWKLGGVKLLYHNAPSVAVMRTRQGL